jgi:hypothetical protein
VEEQFYILFPLALWLVYRLRASRYLTLMLALAGVGSLLLAGVLSPRNPVFRFYLMPTRGWELLLGGILASYAGGVPGGRAGREIAGWGGLAMIAAAVVLFTPDTPVPGFPALLPCVGAALLLWAGREGEHSAGRLLSNRVFVGIGLISYSLYLWHWPLLVIPRLYLLRPLTGWETAASILAGVALAALSWRFVEQPFRQGGSRPWRFSREQRSIATGIGLIAASTMVAALLWTGAPQRLPRQVAELDRWSTLKPTGLPCADPRTQGRTPRCVLDPAQTGTPKVVLWGDSHAAQYLTALEPLVRSRGGELRDATSPGCPPFPGVTPIRAGRADAECMKRNQQVLASILADPSVQSVVIAGRWARYFFPLSDPEAARLLVGGKEQPSSRALETSLEATVRALTDRNIKVVLIGQAPEFDLPLPECLAKTAWRRLPESRCEFKTQTLPGGPQHVALAAVLARNPEVAYLDPTRPLCSREGCTRHLGTAPVSWDADHLSPAGAATVIAGFPVDSLPAGNVRRNKPSQGFSRPRLRHSL